MLAAGCASSVLCSPQSAAAPAASLAPSELLALSFIAPAACTRKHARLAAAESVLSDPACAERVVLVRPRASSNSIARTRRQHAERQRCAHRRNAEPFRHCCSAIRRTDPANAQSNCKFRTALAVAHLRCSPHRLWLCFAGRRSATSSACLATHELLRSLLLRLRTQDCVLRRSVSRRSKTTATQHACSCCAA